jgi:uncharacterized protein with NAD-binding domain and iron-sulfur cluster
MHATQKPTKRRIIVLGGGIAALSSVFALTNVPNWQDHFDVTLYQVGWRLGGKCASGRNAKKNFRLEEHGLHVWGGFYENAFWMAKKCYQELDRPASAPLSTWQEAFIDQHVFFLKETDWQFWPFCLPNCDALEPGFNENDSPEGLRDVLAQLVDSFQAWFTDFLNSETASSAPPLDIADASDLLRKAIKTGSRLSQTVFSGIVNLLQALIREGTRVALSATGRIFRLLRRLIKKLIFADSTHDFKYNQHRWIIYDLLLTTFIGIFADHLLTRSIDDTIGDLEYGVWLKKHGLSAETWQSTLIHAMYDLIFAFPSGEFGVQNRDINAASMLKIILQILRYRGAPIYRMKAGMGDSVIAPLYEVLKRRGVKFEFFHGVTNLRLSPDKTRLVAVDLCRQVKLKGADYNPLIDIDGLPCWPSEPRYEQFEEGNRLESLIEAGQLNLEAPDGGWDGEEPLTLHLGRDFDEAIFGISIGAIPYLCKELIAADPRWDRMVKTVTTIPTQSLQIWLRPSLRELGWMQVPDAYTLVKRAWMLSPLGCTADTEAQRHEKFLNEPPMVGGIYTRPNETMDTWVAMDHLIEIESYAPGTIGTVAYFTGLVKQPPENLHITQESRDSALATVAVNAQNIIDTIIPNLWRTADRSIEIGGGDKELVVDSYIRSNTLPSDLYVLSNAGTKKYRLSCQDRHFGNLWIVGDWTGCRLDMGYVEAAVTSGLLAARALLKDISIPGYAPRIMGGSDYYWLDSTERRSKKAIS